MSLSPNGERSLFHREQGNINMDMIRVERLDLRALGGADTVTINDVSATDSRQADVALGGADAAIDTVIVNSTENADHINAARQAGRARRPTMGRPKGRGSGASRSTLPAPGGFSPADGAHDPGECRLSAGRT
jgi:hypothetical protein